MLIGGIPAEAGQKAAEAVSAKGGTVAFQRTDVRSADEVEALVEAAVARFGRLDVMVNNAGVFDGFADCVETTEALWDQVIDINLKGCFLGCRAALKRMTPQGSGRIVNTASVGGLRGAADGLSYTASKFGIIGLTRQAAVTHSQFGITINAICPGVIATEIRANSAAILGADGPDMQRGARKRPGRLQAHGAGQAQGPHRRGRGRRSVPRLRRRKLRHRPGDRHRWRLDRDMSRLDDFTDEEREILSTVRRFVAREVRPHRRPPGAGGRLSRGRCRRHGRARALRHGGAGGPWRPAACACRSSPG